MESDNNNASLCNPFINVYANTDAYTYTIKIEPKLEAEALKPKLKALKNSISKLPLNNAAKKFILPDSIIKKSILISTARRI